MDVWLACKTSMDIIAYLWVPCLLAGHFQLLGMRASRSDRLRELTHSPLVGKRRHIATGHLCSNKPVKISN